MDMGKQFTHTHELRQGKQPDALPTQAGNSPIRPSSLSEYVGQTDIKENLKVFIKACKMRDEDGKYESEDGIIKCEDNVCVYDNGNGRIVLTCK